MKSRTLIITLISVTLSLSVVLASVSFQDVLETPALKSPLAAKSLMVGTTMAGKRIIGVGQRGHIIYSDDQGKNWSQATVPVCSDLVAVHFPTPQKGWAVGHDGVVLHSSDSGVTWTKQFDGRAAVQSLANSYAGGSSPAAGTQSPGNTTDLPDDIRKFAEQGPDKPFLDVWFENETTGFVVGAFSLIFRTTDGGKSWVPWYDRIDNPKRFHLYSIRPVGGELFLTAEQGTVFKLDPKTERFRAIKTPYVGTFFGITGKPGALVAFGMRGNAFYSRDGGIRWEKVETGVSSGLTGGTVLDDGRIVLASQVGLILVSNDNGTSFSQVKVNQPTPAAGVASIGGNALAVAGQRGVQVQTIR